MSNEMQRSAGFQRLVEVSGHEAPEGRGAARLDDLLAPLSSQRMVANLQN
jgi:hypothetical protein